MKEQDKHITVANRFIYYYANFIRGIFGFIAHRDEKSIPDLRYIGHMKEASDRMHDSDPAIDEIVFFHYRKRLMFGYCREILDKGPAIQVIAEDHRRLRLNRNNLIYLSGLSITDDKSLLRSYAESIRKLSTQIDLREIWNLVRGDPEELSIQEIADLYWEDEMDTSRWIALYLHLEQTCPYFKTQRPETYIALPEDEVSVLQHQRERIASLGHELNEFIDWLSAGKEEPYDPETLTKRQRAWLEALRQYALWGTKAQSWKHAREILSELSIKEGSPQQYSFHLLVDKGIWKDEEDLELERAKIPVTFSEEALQEAENIDIGRIVECRKKLKLQVFLLKDENPRCPDLGISIKRRWWQRYYELGMHLPDVASLVPAGSAMDRAASDRMAPLHLPDRLLPMLPNRITEEFARVKTGKLYPMLSVFCKLNKRLEVAGTKIIASVAEIGTTLNSSDIKAICKVDKHPYKKPLRLLEQFAEKLRLSREMTGAAKSFGVPESQVIVKEGEANMQDIQQEHLAFRIIRELSILAGVKVGKYFWAKGIPAIFEVRESPQDLAILEKITNPIVRRHEVNRQMPELQFSLDPGFHHSLGVSGLACVVSPLERYTDLMCQRQLLHYLLSGEKIYSKHDINLIQFRAQEELKEIDAFEHQRQRHWLLKHVSSFIGEPLSATVLYIRWDGVLVELLNYPLKIVVHANREVSIGDEVKVRVSGVNLWKSQAYGSII